MDAAKLKGHLFNAPITTGEPRTCNREFQRIGYNLGLLWRGRGLNNVGGGRRGKMNEDLKFRRPLPPSFHRMGRRGLRNWEHIFSFIFHGNGEKNQFSGHSTYALSIHSLTEQVSRRLKGFLQNCKSCNLQDIKYQ